jgi:flagellar biosynthesis/type III secretory pathway protein FliH
LFRIDRRLVNISGTKFNRIIAEDITEDINEDILEEVDVGEEITDTAASAEQEAIALADEYLSAAKAEAKSKMDEILENAREEAAYIILNARDEAEEELQRGFRQGFEEGSEEGKRSYDEKLAEKIKEDNEALKRVLDELYEERERTYSEMEDGVINLAVEIVRKLINPPEEELTDVYTSLIKNALRQMPTDGKIVIRVGPAEYERFFSSGAATIVLDSGVTVSASVIRDVSLNDGDCIIDTDDVTINAGINSQLEYVKLAFERANQYEPE